MSIGDTLAQARRQAGLSLAQVSQETRIRESIISAIETDDFSSCGGDFYARGHIRSLAAATGIDPVTLIREYDEERGAQAPMRAAQIFESATPIRIRESRSPRLGWVLTVVAVAAIGFGAYHFISAPGPDQKATATSRVRHVAPAKPSASVKPTAAPTPTPHVIARPQTAVIRLAARQDCWVQLSTSSGKSLYQGTIRAGASMTWRERHAVSMVIGNPPGVTLTVDGKAEQMNTVQVVTLSINPRDRTPVTVG